MSLKPLQTHYTGDASLYAPYTGGGGGGGGGSITASTLAVSSIAAIGGGGVEFPNGLVAPTGANIQLGGGNAPNVGDIQFLSNNGQIVGLSTINGAPVRGISTPTTGGGYFSPGVVANLNPSVLVPLSTGRWYQASLEITDMTFVTQPAATDCLTISFGDGVGQTNLGNFNMAQLSTSRGLLGDCGFSVSGPHEAQSTIGAFQYKANSAAPSTFITTGGQGWVVALN